MRYISLKAEKVTAIDKLIAINCGPNFILNRQESFKMMIQEQGIVFWFRFWLTFCCNPAYDLKTIQRRWPLSRQYANIMIHDQFLQGSVEHAIKYSLDYAVQCMRSSEIHDVLQCSGNKNYIQMFKELLQEYSNMAFGCALCLVFYRWLFARKMKSDTHVYWKLPNEYKDPQFEPTVLEDYIVKAWDDNLLTLLGVRLNEVPWLLELSNGGVVAVKCVPDMNEHPNHISKLISSMKRNLENWRIKIQSGDELPKYCTVEKKFFKYQVTQSKHVIQNKKKCRNTCWFCKLVANDRLKAKICQRCVDNKWKKIRSYCSRSCQMEHWFQTHCNEHYDYDLKVQPKQINCFD